MDEVQTVQFHAPFDVRVISGPFPSPPGPNQALIKSKLSAISAGTELLVYRGDMPPDMPTDAAISTQATAFTYPSNYGYAAVGTVSSVGAEASGLAVGDCVFAFREHTSAFTAAIPDLLRVPTDIAAADAVFFPNMETAVSLAMDAALLPGETACVVGQGIVGLLVVAALRKLHPYSTVIAVDIAEPRRRLSRECAGAHAALDPGTAGFGADFVRAAGHARGADVSVDVSGAGGGLDVAIRATRDHGRVVLGSWYGAKEVALASLGGRFHRSHIQVVASQVSHIPPAIAARWSKQRRFELAWKLVRDVQPSRRFPVTYAPIGKAAEMYKQVAAGEHIQVVFTYGE